ncbi:hypothetical protein Mmc1_0671 [Magnetococcus marinus MC-1]|uniref:Uncharacterized protein n=1 Tax=Magnetococcus marinus (strain ATCC BAA-1437 / JCM 17883 / MC-1) TaxID=156889 RepID=A0L5E9_MAGMM|nr:hypothetical protein [Magnetococcus marinus]ABK43192.1 hypothetical protein Mmc1_0671 [Magnetococcus marinus MC-1]
MPSQAEFVWDCRWPDPVALKVANDRLAEALDGERAGLNPALEVMVEMESAARDDGLASALLITPWAIERVYWLGAGQLAPPVQSAYPLEGDAQGRVAAGQGVLLHTAKGATPVVIAWEPETGHHFAQVLLPQVQNYINSYDAMAAAKAVGGAQPHRTKQSLSNHLDKPVSRRGLFNLFRS